MQIWLHNVQRSRLLRFYFTSSLILFCSPNHVCFRDIEHYIAFVLLDIFSKIFIDFCVRAMKHWGWLTRHYFASFVLFANIKVCTHSCIYIQHILQRQKLFVQPSTLLKCVVNTLLLIKPLRPVSIQVQLNPSCWSTRHKNLSVQKHFTINVNPNTI